MSHTGLSLEASVETSSSMTNTSAVTSVRLAAENDLAGIISLTKLVVRLMQAEGNFQWNDNYPVETDFRTDISNGVLWVVASTTDVFGFCALTKDQGEDYKAVWDVSIEAIVPHRLAVHPDCRGKGVAKALLGHAEILAKEMGISWIRVDTNTKNNATNKLFPQMGFQYVGEISLTGRQGLRFNCFEKAVA